MVWLFVPSSHLLISMQMDLMIILNNILDFVWQFFANEGTLEFYRIGHRNEYTIWRMLKQKNIGIPLFIANELLPLPMPSIISIETTPRDNKIAQAPILYFSMSLKSIYLRRSKTWKSLYDRKDERPTASVNARKLVIIWIEIEDFLLPNISYNLYVIK